MDPSHRRKVEEVFEAAMELPPGARPAFLDHACRDDERLRTEVDALLAAHQRGDGILDTPPGARAAALKELARRGGAQVDPGERVGPYRIVDELGSGGMGVVYLAERSDGHFRRRVALKVIPVREDAELGARMVAERQILASLDHPNIARLLDGGVTEDGRPFLVMEYVAGLPVDVYGDRMRLSVRERLELFVTVARAVEHAHRNLVVHRDLKPSNILVSAEGEVKLLDFGIAKLLNPALVGVDAPVTRRGSRLLTPEYASPEQLRGEALSTASDVYSLGVLLYRLLSGHPPFEVDDPSVTAVLSAILEGDPERPSVQALRDREVPGGDGTARRTSAEDRAADRHTTPRRLARVLQGDLDAIVLKALRPEPSRRYGSAESLAQDIERFLRGEPVMARKGNRAYRLGKLLRRHRAAAIAVAGVVVALVVGGGSAAWQAGVARRERDRATEALVQAELARVQAEEVSDFLMELFRSGDPLQGDGGAVTARDLVGRGLRRADALAGQPAVQARMLDVLGQIQHHLGSVTEARSSLERALTVRRSALGGDHPEVARSLIHLARVERAGGRPDRAEVLVREALEIRRRAYPEPHPELAEAVYELGWLTTGPEQERLYREALDIHAAADGDPRQTATMLEGLATNIRRQGRLDEAVELAREALRVREEAFGEGHPETAVAMYHLADHIRDHLKAYDEAERLYLRGLELESRGFGENSLRLVHGLHSLAALRAREGNHAEAEVLLRRAMAIREAATGADNPVLAGSMEQLAPQIALQGRLDEAEAMAREALAHRIRTQGPNHPSLHASHMTLGEVLALAGRLEEASASFEAAFESRLRHGGPDDIILAEHRRRWGRILLRSGDLEAAEPHLSEALAIFRRVYEEEHPNLVDGKRALFELYTAWGRPADAEGYRVPPGEFIPY